MAAILTGSWPALVVSIVVVVAKSVAGGGCLTGDACSKIQFNTTVDNVTYCCSEVNKTASVSTGQPCRCLTAEEKAKEKADSTMDEGRMCLFGKDICADASIQVTTKSGAIIVSCCKNTMFSESTLFSASGPDGVVCRCTNNTAPVLPPGAYVVPLTSLYNTSGEPCLYDALCDDEPPMACKGDSVVYCCYNSRGIHTTNLNATTTGCTCTNDMFGAQCAADLKPVPPTEQRCLTNAACPPAANVVTSGAKYVNVTYCCPNLLVKPHLQLIQGTVPKEMCTCSLRGTESPADESARHWAELTKNYGRWCESGSACQQFSDSLTFRENVSLCCRQPNSSYYFAAYDRDYEAIGCRCANTSVPRPDPNAYIVPDAGRFNSTGESCSYNSKCGDYPSSKCGSSEVILCCYGSRGIHTGTLNNSTTSCTCTNDISGPRCEGQMFPISRSTHVTVSAHLFTVIGLIVFLDVTLATCD